jgi:cellobiose transport system permease protein
MKRTVARSLHHKNSPPEYVKKFILYAVLTGLAFLFLFPFWFMFIGTFRTSTEIFSVKLRLLPERGFLDFSNIDRLIKSGFFYNMRTTFTIAIIRTLSNLFFCSLAGYAFSKIRFPFQNALLFFLIFTMMVPFQVIVIPMYMMMVSFKWLNTLRALIVPGLVGAFGIFIMRQYMSSTPNDIIDSAKIDGCNHFITYLRIILPLVQPGLIVFGIITFMGVWNDFMWPLIIVQNEKLYTITLRIAAFRADPQYVRHGAILFASFISSLPMITLFIIFRNRLLTGLVSGSFR